MGGEIHLESEKGCGTTVWVNIPCKRIAIENKVIV
jgi:signal transduction histidine kinase